MKKLGLILVCFLLTTTAFATDKKFGFAMGFNNTFYSGSDYDDFLKVGWPGMLDNQGRRLRAESAFRLAPEFGIFLEIPLTEKIAIQPEFNLIWLSHRYTVSGGADSNLYKERSRSETKMFFEFPVLVKYELILGSVRLTPFIGPSLLVPVTSEIRRDVPKNDDPSKTGEASMIFAAILGVGYSMEAGPGFLYADLRYRRQLTGHEYLGSDDGKPTEKTAKMKANKVGIRVGYGFNF